MKEMMEVMMAGMEVWMLIGFLLVVFVVAVAVYLVLRTGSGHRHVDTARELLDRRLASGEITTEEYHERESALRTSQPPGRGRR
jgi:uncharacterized membrane protein